RIPLTSAQDIVDEIPLIRERMQDDFANSDLGVQITGQAVLAGIMQTNMIDSQLTSFSVALAVVSLMMILLLRSVPLGMLAIIPNLLPIVVGLGAMALADISFNPATVMIAAVALGIVVDDTVHMMTVFDREVRAGRQTADAIRTTIMEVGRPVFVTSVLLAAGFGLLVFGSFLPSRQIGGVIAVIVIAALATDLVVLPAILRETFSPSRTDG
ncbi:MAG: MMPL family transporter, partial [Woeseiaceae bacterium]